jgi:hypothetical protein
VQSLESQLTTNELSKKLERDKYQLGVVFLLLLVQFSSLVFPPEIGVGVFLWCLASVSTDIESVRLRFSKRWL